MSPFGSLSRAYSSMTPCLYPVGGISGSSVSLQVKDGMNVYPRDPSHGSRSAYNTVNAWTHVMNGILTEMGCQGAKLGSYAYRY